MTKPTRILVFGILCLGMGLVLGLTNTSELVYAVVGPRFVEIVPQSFGSGAIQESYEDSSRMMQAALRKPVYRVGLGVEAALSILMAGLLMVAGVGLLIEKRWALLLTKIWAYYAIIAAVWVVFLQTRYFLPESAEINESSLIFGGLLSLITYWIFPVLLLLMLGRPIVTDYLNQVATRPGPYAPTAPASRMMAHSTAPEQARPLPHRAVPTRPPPTPQVLAPSPPPQPQPLPSASEPEPARSADADQPAELPDTWRDDPWNAPDSQ